MIYRNSLSLEIWALRVHCDVLWIDECSSSVYGFDEQSVLGRMVSKDGVSMDPAKRGTLLLKVFDFSYHHV